MTTEHFDATDFVIGRMSPAEHKQAESHLAGCSQCQAAVSAVRQDQERASETLIALTDFAFRLLQGSVSMVGPFLRKVPFESTSTPDESSKLPKFEPLRVLQPRVARKAGQLIGRFGLVILLPCLLKKKNMVAYCLLTLNVLWKNFLV